MMYPCVWIICKSVDGGVGRLNFEIPFTRVGTYFPLPLSSLPNPVKDKGEAGRRNCQHDPDPEPRDVF
jgi:hypothetical protein